MVSPKCCREFRVEPGYALDTMAGWCGTPPGGYPNFAITTSDNVRDVDVDFFSDLIDNCVTVSNFDQADADRDGLGDKCDSTP
jgi:hypothetical protein